MKLHNKTIESFLKADCLLAPGELVEISGVYEVCHHDEKRTTVVLLRTTIFPCCRQCGDLVRYRILNAVQHISEDPDFQEEPLQQDNPRHEMQIPTFTFPMQLSRSHGFRFQQKPVRAWSSGPDGRDL